MMRDSSSKHIYGVCVRYVMCACTCLVGRLGISRQACCRSVFAYRDLFRSKYSVHVSVRAHVLRILNIRVYA